MPRQAHSKVEGEKSNEVGVSEHTYAWGKSPTRTELNKLSDQMAKVERLTEASRHQLKCVPQRGETWSQLVHCPSMSLSPARCVISVPRTDGYMGNPNTWTRTEGEREEGEPRLLRTSESLHPAQLCFPPIHPAATHIEHLLYTGLQVSPTSHKSTFTSLNVLSSLHLPSSSRLFPMP